ncbi:MAG: hypothetical protein HRU38_17975 [Saccharospirillaceae bacterium]|nr:hypothetical protein [Pseudomonadales bacterium]NRB80526.1 hypothetical protein [Saccharospirillaceae bacterium]
MTESFFMILFLVIPLILFPFGWVLVLKRLQKKAKMLKVLDIELGESIAVSKWGSAVINGVSFQNSIQISEFELGYIFETKKIFGQTKIWLPKLDLNLGEIQPKKYVKPKSRKVSSGQHEVVVISGLCEFFEALDLS